MSFLISHWCWRCYRCCKWLSQPSAKVEIKEQNKRDETKWNSRLGHNSTSRHQFVALIFLWFVIEIVVVAGCSASSVRDSSNSNHKQQRVALAYFIITAIFEPLLYDFFLLSYRCIFTFYYRLPCFIDINHLGCVFLLLIFFAPLCGACVCKSVREFYLSSGIWYFTFWLVRDLRRSLLYFLICQIFLKAFPGFRELNLSWCEYVENGKHFHEVSWNLIMGFLRNSSHVPLLNLVYI